MRDQQRRHFRAVLASFLLFGLLSNALAHASVSAEAIAQPRDTTPAMPGSRSPGRRLVLCLDGTWNSTFDKSRTESGGFVLKPTNVLKLCRAVLPRDAAGISQITYYHTGVGSVARYPGVANATYSLLDHYLGGIWGAGFESNVEAALTFLNTNFQPGDAVYIFGFSRGAATARGVTQFLGWAGGLPTRNDAYYLPALFREFIRVRGDGDARDWIARTNARRNSEHPPRGSLAPFNALPVTYLGVWDTVMALGSRFEATGVKNATVSQSFFVDEQPAKGVRVAWQALAIDERRYDFRPEIWVRARPEVILRQRWFPGVHANVGGGYRHDGLADSALRWLLRGAAEQGLGLDDDFLAHYRPYPQDRLYDSYTFWPAFFDTVRFKRNAGIRRIGGQPDTANLSLDPSFAQRLIADPKATTDTGAIRFPRMDGVAYRPDNALQFLACEASAQQQLGKLLMELENDEQRGRLEAVVEVERERRCPQR